MAFPRHLYASASELDSLRLSAKHPMPLVIRKVMEGGKLVYRLDCGHQQPPTHLQFKIGDKYPCKLCLEKSSKLAV